MPVAGARHGAAVATRRACTRCGCRSSRCRSAWCSSPARRSRGRRTACLNAFVQAGVPKQAIADLPRPRRHRRRGAQQLPAQPDLRRHRHGRAVQGQPARAGARPRLQQDPPRRRQGRSVGEVPRHHGRQHLRQQRPRLHQLLRRLGVAAHGEDRRGDRRNDRPDRAAAAGGPEGGAGARSPCRARPTASTATSKPP